MALEHPVLLQLGAGSVLALLHYVCRTHIYHHTPTWPTPFAPAPPSCAPAPAHHDIPRELPVGQPAEQRPVASQHPQPAPLERRRAPLQPPLHRLPPLLQRCQLRLSRLQLLLQEPLVGRQHLRAGSAGAAPRGSLNVIAFACDRPGCNLAPAGAMNSSSQAPPQLLTCMSTSLMSPGRSSATWPCRRMTPALVSALHTRCASSSVAPPLRLRGRMGRGQCGPAAVQRACRKHTAFGKCTT